MLLKTFRAAVILTFFSRIVEADEVSRGNGSEKISLVRQCLEVLLVNRLAVRGPEYFGAIRLLQATIYLLFGVIHVDNFQLYKWFEKLILGCLDY